MTAMNEPEHNISLLEQIDKLTEELNRYRTALQDIREIEVQSYFDAAEMKNIAREALEGEEAPGVKVNHEGRLFVIGESTIEYIPDDGSNPFKRIKKGE